MRDTPYKNCSLPGMGEHLDEYKIRIKAIISDVIHKLAPEGGELRSRQAKAIISIFSELIYDFWHRMYDSIRDRIDKYDPDQGEWKFVKNYQAVVDNVNQKVFHVENLSSEEINALKEKLKEVSPDDNKVFSLEDQSFYIPPEHYGSFLLKLIAESSGMVANVLCISESELIREVNKIIKNLKASEDYKYDGEVEILSIISSLLEMDLDIDSGTYQIPDRSILFDKITLNKEKAALLDDIYDFLDIKDNKSIVQLKLAGLLEAEKEIKKLQKSGWIEYACGIIKCDPTLESIGKRLRELVDIEERVNDEQFRKRMENILQIVVKGQPGKV